MVDYFDEYLEGNKHDKVIWKKNQEMLTAQPVKRARNIEIVIDEQKFVDLLPNAKLVVLDRPSTTSLEACMTNKPVFVLLANKNWRLLPEKLLKKRAVVAYTPAELKNAVQAYLEDGAYPADVSNREFVRAYGCYQDDGLSAQRAVDELLDIIQFG